MTANRLAFHSSWPRSWPLTAVLGSWEDLSSTMCNVVSPVAKLRQRVTRPWQVRDLLQCPPKTVPVSTQCNSDAPCCADVPMHDAAKVNARCAFFLVWGLPKNLSMSNVQTRQCRHRSNALDTVAIAKCVLSDGLHGILQTTPGLAWAGSPTGSRDLKKMESAVRARWHRGNA